MLSIKLWILYLYQAVKNGFLFRYIRKVNDEEVLGRALFDGFNYKKRSGKIATLAFKQKKQDREISVTRLLLAPFQYFVQLSQQDAMRRSINAGRDVEFCGFAEIETLKLRKIILKDNKKFTVFGTPERRNPFHASIMIEPDDGKAYELYIREALVSIAKLNKYSA